MDGATHRRIRDALGLRPTALARLVGVARSSVYGWERGAIEIHPSHVALMHLLARHPELVEDLRAMVDTAESARA